MVASNGDVFLNGDRSPSGKRRQKKRDVCDRNENEITTKSKSNSFKDRLKRSFRLSRSKSEPIDEISLTRGRKRKLSSYLFCSFRKSESTKKVVKGVPSEVEDDENCAYHKISKEEDIVETDILDDVFVESEKGENSNSINETVLVENYNTNEDEVEDCEKVEEANVFVSEQVFETTEVTINQSVEVNSETIEVEVTLEENTDTKAQEENEEESSEDEDENILENIEEEDDEIERSDEDHMTFVNSEIDEICEEESNGPVVQVDVNSVAIEELEGEKEEEPTEVEAAQVVAIVPEIPVDTNEEAQEEIVEVESVNEEELSSIGSESVDDIKVECQITHDNVSLISDTLSQTETEALDEALNEIIAEEEENNNLLESILMTAEPIKFEHTEKRVAFESDFMDNNEEEDEDLSFIEPQTENSSKSSKNKSNGQVTVSDRLITSYNIKTRYFLTKLFNFKNHIWKSKTTSPTTNDDKNKMSCSHEDELTADNQAIIGRDEQCRSSIIFAYNEEHDPAKRSSILISLNDNDLNKRSSFVIHDASARSSFAFTLDDDIDLSDLIDYANKTFDGGIVYRLDNTRDIGGSENNIENGSPLFNRKEKYDSGICRSYEMLPHRLSLSESLHLGAGSEVLIADGPDTL